MCGGLSVLQDLPASPCGQCQDGRFECVSQNAVVCNGASGGQNACGGCGTPLVGDPGASCGACGGVWECDGTQAVTCSQRINLCGSCVDLAQTPGSTGDCGADEIVTCDGSLATTCRDAALYNACGGSNQLANEPGQPCGACGDGKFVCVGNSATACVEDDQTQNQCGGCTLLNAAPGDSCAPGQVWTCDGTDQVICELTPPDMNVNACGGTAMLPSRPGDVCQECGSLACDSGNTDVLVCVGGSTGTQTDPNNCGMCGMRCLPGEDCVAGQCVFDRVVDVAAGFRHTLVRTAGGSVYAWGLNQTAGPIGDGSTIPIVETPSKTALIDDAIDIAACVTKNSVSDTSCAIRASGEVWCWGANDQGQLGAAPSVLPNSPIPVKVNGISDAAAIECQYSSVCVRKTDNTLWCWGNNDTGQLGRGSIINVEATPAQVSNLTDVADFAMARRTTCALNSSGAIYCWGAAGEGALGDGRVSTGETTPQLVPGSYQPFTEIVEAYLGFAALNAAGVFVWGRMPNGSNGGDFGFGVPTSIAGTTGATRVYGLIQSFAVEDASGVLRYWGPDDGESGDIGSNGNVAGLALGPVPGDPTIIEVDGINDGSIVLGDDGSLNVSGRSPYLGDGQIRNGSATLQTRRFHPVQGLLPVNSESSDCRDGLDNDGDGLTDCEDDDCSESIGSSVGAGAITGIAGTGWYSYYAPLCGTIDFLQDKVYAWVAPQSGTYEITEGASVARLGFQVRDGCGPASAELVCDVQNAGGSTVQFAATAGQTYYIVVEAIADGAVAADINLVP